MTELLTDERILGPLLLSLKVLAVAGGILLPGGVLLAWYLSGKPSPVRSLVDFLVAVPLVFPPIATGFILLMLLGRRGPLASVMPLDIVFAFPGLVLASIVSGLPPFGQTRGSGPAQPGQTPRGSRGGSRQDPVADLSAGLAPVHPQAGADGLAAGPVPA
jgi:hypothetical protein